MIPYGRQSISEDDIAAVVSVLRSDFLTQGPVVPQFEQAVAEKVGAAHGVAVNSATSALHVACMALGVGPGDLVWTSPNSFVASSNCALYCGAKVDFVDIDSQTLCMSVDALEAKLVRQRGSGQPLPKVVIPVHFGGQSCDMAEIHRLAQEFSFAIIEDGSHAIGGHYRPSQQEPFQPIGNCRYSDICVFSFHPVKIITTGEGGMALTNNKKLALALGRYRSHGISSLPEDLQARPASEVWNYQMLELGYNYRMTDIQAALGLSQLQKLDTFVSKRQDLAHTYDQALPHLSPQKVPSYTQSSRHLYPIQVSSNKQKQVHASLKTAGFAANLHYIPIHLQPYYQKLGFKRGDFPAAEAYFEGAVTLPLYPDLTDDEQQTVISFLVQMA
jgi:UDP-4-amino-4,6-dideoxy-N-acetyl-beta-L-altrosamine transaminase